MDSTIPVLAQIRTHYPAPLAEQNSTGTEGEYCVGTAVCRFYGYDVDNFVGESELASILATINSALDGPPGNDNEEGAPALAWAFASAITAANDARDFEEAWRVVGEALASQGTGGAE